MTLPLDYVLTTLIASLGLFAGVGVGWIAKEELSDGKKYFELFQSVLLAAAMFVVALAIDPLLAVIASVLAFALFHYYPKTKSSVISYILLAFVFVFFMEHALFLLLATITLLYGLTTGSLLFMQKTWLRNSLVTIMVFNAVALGLPLVLLNI